MPEPTEDSIQKILYKFTVAGIILLVVRLAPKFVFAIFAGDTFSIMANGVAGASVVVVLFLVITLYVRIYQEFNWARRIFIAYNVFTITGFLFVPVLEHRIPPIQFGNILETIQLGLYFIGFSWGVAYTIYLFRPHVRALFTDTPPKLYHRVVLILVAIAFTVWIDGLTDQLGQL